MVTDSSEMNLGSVWIGSSVSVISDYLVNTEVTSSDVCLLVRKKKIKKKKFSSGESAIWIRSFSIEGHFWKE